MATVRFSDELRRDIERNASRIFDKRISEARENPPDNWAGNLYDLMYSATKEQMNALPVGYFGEEEDFDISGFGGKNWDTNINQRICMGFGNDEKRRFPHDTREDSNYKAQGITENSGYDGYTLDAADPRWSEYKKLYKAWCLKIIKLEAEQESFVQGVHDVVHAYVTLAPALKAWPALWDLVPDDKKEKHREIVVRTKAADTAANLAEEVDLSKLTGLVTADKLTK